MFREILIIKKSKREIIIEPFDIDNEMPLTVNDGDEEYTTYLTAQDVYSIVNFMQTQLLELERLEK